AAGNRLVVKDRLPGRAGVMVEVGGEATEHVQHRVSAQVQKRDLDVHAVTETLEGQGTIFELPQQFVSVTIAHCPLLIVPLCDGRSKPELPLRKPAKRRRRSG